MSNLASIVEKHGALCKSSFGEQNAWAGRPASKAEIRRSIEKRIADVFAFLEQRGDERSFGDVERGLIPHVFALGRLFLAFFLAVRQAQGWSRGVPRGTRAGQAQARLLGTFFGKVRYWRTYVRESGGTGGAYPLDAALGLTADGFSMLVLSLAARLSTVVSFDQVTALLMTFLSWSPSKTSVEKAVLGFGRHTAQWFREAPAPEGDGDVLVIEIDSKATPTARDSELEKRRRKRRPPTHTDSPRHRGRTLRSRRAPKIRRKKGDKSKNGKAATLVVMYTLRREKDAKGAPFLVGPLNRRVYASYAGKRHAFAIARREADKRGFKRGSGKTIQLLTDGDEDFECYGREFFLEAIHTLDVMHALEYVSTAGRCLYREGSDEFAEWFEGMKALVYRGHIKKLLTTLRTAQGGIPKTGPGSKDRRERFAGAIVYLSKRVHLMNYGWLLRHDLEISTGSVEGAVKHVIAKRFDNGSMRWIRERAEALLQLRCIEINGDWEAFIEFVQANVDETDTTESGARRLLTSTPSALPTFGLAS